MSAVDFIGNLLHENFSKKPVLKAKRKPAKKKIVFDFEDDTELEAGFPDRMSLTEQAAQPDGLHFNHQTTDLYNTAMTEDVTHAEQNDGRDILERKNVSPLYNLEQPKRRASQKNESIEQTGSDSIFDEFVMVPSKREKRLS